MIGTLAALVVISGCAVQQKTTKSFSKTFFDRTISYTIDPEAKECMNKLERLLSFAYQEDMPLPDKIAVSLYKETDSFIERDHHITLQEAKGFYGEYVMRFEDSLGSVKSNQVKSKE